MTEGRLIGRVREETVALLLLGATVVFGVMMSAEVGEYVREGMLLAVSSVIPTSLPFMVISDMYVCYGRPERIGVIRRCFTALFGIGEGGIAPFICGNIGGFPIGAKMCAEAYSRGALGKEETERLIPLSNNPSCAFVVGGVGMGLYGDMRVGVLMLISLYVATLLCGSITRVRHEILPLTVGNVNNSYDFIASVRGAGANSITVISFISVFSGLLGIIKKRVKYAPLLYVFYAFAEVTNAVKSYSSATCFKPVAGMILSTFALGFGGVSVALQASVFAAAHGLKMRRYFPIKLMEGIISASVFSILYMI